uniref:Uncharacterized protein LOC104223441 n=2 Tax=Nicotiana sylvestris TaxID=4096 RepID=A0A1U7WG21_NICSY|nr:PREDICTED: uncharacterized protein LOC104223441 [Nicotiana sylvestris]
MGHGKYGLAKFFESFPALKASPLGLLCGVQSLVAGEVPKELPSALTRLYLSDVCVDEGWTLCALCLIRSSPYLQEIEVQLDYELSNIWWLDQETSCVSLEVKGFSNVPILNHLRVVKVINTTGKKCEKLLIKLLLAKSLMLVRMVIETRLDSPVTRLELPTELIQFPRASPNAEVIYIGS